MNTKKYSNTSAFAFRQGFTIIEILVIAPIVILVIGTFISAIVSMTGEVLVSRGTASLSYNIQDALNRIEQDITNNGTYLATNNISLISPQGYNNDTSNFRNADAINGTMLILNTYATTENPSSPTRNIVYIPNTPNSCNSALINANSPVIMNVVYFVKNNTLWRRTITNGSYATIGCSIPWQQPSCAPGVVNAFCKTQDIRLVDGIKSGGFSVGYYPSPISTTASSIASDSTQTNITRSVALQTNNTAVVTITATNTIAGRSVTQTGTIRAVSPNTIQTIVTNGLVLNLDAGNPGSYPGSGAIWTDLSGNGNNGTLMNGVSYTNNNDGATVLDGVDDYVDLPDRNWYSPNGFSISAWVLNSDFSGSWERIIDFGNGPGSDNILLARPNTGTGNVMWSIRSGSTPYEFNVNNVLTAGEWAYLVGTVDANGVMKLYKNGVLVGTKSDGINVANVVLTNNYIGKSNWGDANWDGKFSVVQIYNRTLPTTEVQQNFNALRGRYGV